MPETVIPFQPKDENGNLLSMKTRTNTIYKPNGDPLGDDFLGTADIADNLTTQDPTKVLSAKQGAALNSTLSGLFKYKLYTGTYSVSAGNSVNIKGNDIGKASNPAGYSAIGFRNINSGAAGAVFQYINPITTGDNTVATIRNTSSVNISTGNFSITILYVNSNYLSELS